MNKDFSSSIEARSKEGRFGKRLIRRLLMLRRDVIAFFILFLLSINTSTGILLYASSGLGLTAASMSLSCFRPINEHLRESLIW